MFEVERRMAVAICETQPLTVDGLKAAVTRTGRYYVAEVVSTLDDAIRVLLTVQPRVMLIDKAAAGISVAEWLERSGKVYQAAFVIWGSSISDAEALAFLKAGAKGVLRKSADAAEVVACLDAVAAGGTWIQQPFSFAGQAMPRRHDLTAREQQVLDLVERGYRNKEIAAELGIRPGTVKIHIKHIFEKTGIHGRYGLALSGLRYRVGAPALGKTA